MFNRGARLVGLALLVTIPVLAAQVAVAGLLDSQPRLAWLTVFAFALAVLLVSAPGPLLIAALPTTYLYYRVGGRAADISVADLSLGVALLAAVPFVPWRSSMLRTLLKILLVYLLILAVPLIAVPSNRAVAEWGHRAFLVGAGLFVGAAIVATNRHRVALRAYLAASSIVATAAIVDAVAHWGSGTLPPPAYPFGIQKNAAGFLLACAVIIVIVVPKTVSLPRVTRVPCLTLLIVGVAVCQARGAAIMLVGVLALWIVRKRQIRLSPLLFMGAVLLIAMTYVTADAAFQSDAQDTRFNSVNSRLATYDVALDLWKQDPMVGVGLKFWRDPSLAAQTGFGEPHDLVVSALGESGVVGLIALVVLVGATLKVLSRNRSALGQLAVLVVIAKAVDSIIGIYWVAGTLTLMWIIVGLACVPAVETQEGDGARELVAAP